MCCENVAGIITIYDYSELCQCGVTQIVNQYNIVILYFDSFCLSKSRVSTLFVPFACRSLNAVFGCLVTLPNYKHEWWNS